MLEFDSVDTLTTVLRERYLDSLAEPQELYLEQQVAAGTPHVSENLAYAVVFEGALVEFYVVPEETGNLVEVFDAAMDATGASKVLCKSYDTPLLYAALSRNANVTTAGLLFRRIDEPAFSEKADVTFRKGKSSDVDKVLEFNDDFFADEQEIRDYAARDGLFLLTEGSEVIGCGIGKPVIEGRPDIDIGMLVASKHRRRGYGAHVISYLKAYYLAKGLRPICGCSIHNIGSQRALKSAGFVSEHRLLEISY